MAEFFPDSHSSLKESLKIYSETDVFQDRGWRDIDFYNKDVTTEFSRGFEDNNFTFNPRFRIVLGSDTPVFRK
ncbi:hypothetical protein GCM10023184_36750 [Flaviaesturariibacter amylovorans]|uniref:Uncharacterized protein n=2 Tax=Flaviaesturariibacter amylovorans TaxID=1084520 RepID=A0ABP8HHZ7_9BACT